MLLIMRPDVKEMDKDSSRVSDARFRSHISPLVYLSYQKGLSYTATSHPLSADPELKIKPVCRTGSKFPRRLCCLKQHSESCLCA